MKEKKVKEFVKEHYGNIAKRHDSRYERSVSCCTDSDLAGDISRGIGYSDEELSRVPEGANLGLGCGNPVALASLKEGETVIDLGSGAGFDCFLAANAVGPTGKVIGVDMTSEMIEKARENAKRGNYPNVEFRRGDIENLPVADNSVDAVISNCVINLVPDKSGVFEETFRVLKPGGRLMISDIVLLKELPDKLINSIDAYVGCLSGAILRDEYLRAIEKAGFQSVEVVEEAVFPLECMTNDPTAEAIIKSLNIPVESLKDTLNTVASIKVYGVKP